MILQSKQLQDHAGTYNVIEALPSSPTVISIEQLGLGDAVEANKVLHKLFYHGPIYCR